MIYKGHQHNKSVVGGKKSRFRLLKPHIDLSLNKRAIFSKSLLTSGHDFPKLAPVPARQERQFGEVSEWLKEHAWKVCIRQRIGGSNPPLTAIFKEELVRKYGLFFRILHTPGAPAHVC